MNRTIYKTSRIGLAMCSALLAIGAAGRVAAGEFQLGVRTGKTWLDIKGSRLSSGNSVDDSLLNLGFTAAYRWERGGFIEVGTSGSGSIDLFGIQSVDHDWIGGGWQYVLRDKWRLTPKAGLTYSQLTSSEENLFDSEPVDEFSDVVPFVEIALERRFGRVFGMGVQLRNTFEDWGSTREFCLSFGWAIH